MFTQVTLCLIRSCIVAGWQANIALVQSQSYSLSKHIPLVQQERLVVWDCNDKIIIWKHAEHNRCTKVKACLGRGLWTLQLLRAVPDSIVDFALNAKEEQVPSSYQTPNHCSWGADALYLRSCRVCGAELTLS